MYVYFVGYTGTAGRYTYGESAQSEHKANPKDQHNNSSTAEAVKLQQ